MKRERFLIVSIVVLLGCNIAILAILLSPPPHPGHKVAALLKHELKYTAAQMAQFDKLRAAHRVEMDKLHEQTTKVLDNYTASLLKRHNNYTTDDSLAKVFAHIQARRISITMAHFDALKQLGDTEQQKKFGVMLPAIRQMMMPQRPKPRRS